MYKRQVLGDEYDPNQERDETGKWSAAGGGGGQSKEQEAAAAAVANASALYAQLKGNSAERVAMRKALKSSSLSKEDKDKLKQRIVDSFKKDYDKAVKQGKDLKAAQLDGKMGKYAKMYGVEKPATITTTAQANAGYTASEISGGQAAAQAAAQATGKTGAYTPEEIKAFNDLAQMVGSEAAKSYSAQSANNKYVKNGTLKPSEAAHIMTYTGSYHAAVNRNLRKGTTTVQQQGHVNQLNAALDKLPNYEGTVYRKVVFSNASKAAHYVPGAVVEERAFTSTSYDPKVWSGSTHFEIVSKTGKNIESFSQHPHENEVLFSAGTKFKILSNETTYDKWKTVTGRKIRMEELRAS